jgi:hypothetical protein
MEVVGVNGRVGDAVDGVVLATLYRSDPALRSDDNLLLLRRLLLRTLLDAIRSVHLSGDQLELGLLVWQVKAHLQVLASLEIDEASLQVNVLLVPRLVAVFLPHGWV